MEKRVLLTPYNAAFKFPSWSLIIMAMMMFGVDAVVDLRVKGPPSVVIQMKSGRTMVGHASLLQSSAPLGLWCQAVDAHTLEVVPAEQVTFRHGGHKFPATFVDDRHLNATFTRDQINVEDAGTWTCHVRTKFGNATGDITVFLRPVINTALRVDDRSSSKFYFDLSGLTVIRGEDASLECPVFGHPKPTIRWSKNGKPLDNVRMEVRANGVLTIHNTTYADGGTYVCTALNTFLHKGQSQQFDVKMDRHLRVKSEYAWIPPLLIIIVVVILLVTIIVLCEFRKRRNEQKLLETDEE